MRVEHRSRKCEMIIDCECEEFSPINGTFLTQVNKNLKPSFRFTSYILFYKNDQFCSEANAILPIIRSKTEPECLFLCCVSVCW